jgi:integrase
VARLRKRKRGGAGAERDRLYWEADFGSVSGKRERLGLGPCDEVPRRDAQERLDVLVAERVDRGDVGFARLLHARRKPVSLAEGMIDLRSLDRRPGTKRRHESAYRRLVEFFGADRPLAAISQRDLARFAAAERARGLKPASINANVATLCAIATLQHRYGRIPERLNFAAEKTARNKVPHVLTREERDRLLIALTAANARNGRLFTVAAFTGARVASEVYPLTRDQVDLGRGTITFRETKDCEDRVVGLHDEAVRVLREQFAEEPFGPYVFPGRFGGRINDLRHPFAAAVAAAGIRPCTPHVLRHTWATLYLEAGGDAESLRRDGGWASLDQVMTYVHMTDQRRAEAVKAIPAIQHLPHGGHTPARPRAKKLEFTDADRRT